MQTETHAKPGLSEAAPSFVSQEVHLECLVHELTRYMKQMELEASRKNHEVKVMCVQKALMHDILSAKLISEQNTGCEKANDLFVQLDNKLISLFK